MMIQKEISIWKGKLEMEIVMRNYDGIHNIKMIQKEISIWKGKFEMKIIMKNDDGIHNIKFITTNIGMDGFWLYKLSQNLKKKS